MRVENYMLLAQLITMKKDVKQSVQAGSCLIRCQPFGHDLLSELKITLYPLTGYGQPALTNQPLLHVGLYQLTP